MTTALFHLRTIQIGLQMADLDCLSYGEVLDIFTEKGNDEYNYKELASQEDFDRF